MTIEAKREGGRERERVMERERDGFKKKLCTIL